MPTYYDVCAAMDRAGPYMSDVIGKCLREINAFSTNKRSQAQRYLLASKTYEAAMARRDLKSEFCVLQAQKGFLLWQESRAYGSKAEYPVEVDEAAGVLRQLNADVYGVLSDVFPCLHRKIAGGTLVRWESAHAQSAVDPTQSEIDMHDANKSTFGTSGRRGRIQQNEWAKRVAELWGHKCVVTGCDDPKLLDGAHIVWHRDGTTKERLDEQNGIYLATHLHRAFDRGYITFSDEGVLLFSETFTPAARKALGLPEHASLPFVPDRTREYLRQHRKRFGFPV